LREGKTTNKMGNLVLLRDRKRKWSHLRSGACDAPPVAYKHDWCSHHIAGGWDGQTRIAGVPALPCSVECIIAYEVEERLKSRRYQVAGLASKSTMPCMRCYVAIGRGTLAANWHSLAAAARAQPTKTPVRWYCIDFIGFDEVGYRGLVPGRGSWHDNRRTLRSDQ